MILSLTQLRDLAARVGFPDPALAAAVAKVESGGNTCAQGDPNTGVHACGGPNGVSTSFGLWQIHTTAHPQYDPTRLLQDPVYNAQAAYAISGGGTNWAGPWWTTMHSGAWRRWYQPALTPPTARDSTAAAVVGLLAVAAAAGYAAFRERMV